jgi:16S rRNA (cytidine1402-2'-O)-methyltransferase
LVTPRGTLFVVATPIGNLEDLTFRAVATLRAVSLALCEDTRRAQVLLQRFDLHTPLSSFPPPREAEKIPLVLARLEQGEDVALISDAGTPLVSDPGNRLVAACVEAGFRVVPIPGASALTTLLSACPLPTDRFQFVGFPPKKGRERREWLERVTTYPGTSVLFLAGRECAEVLEALEENGGAGQVVIGRELTKLHEEIKCGPLATTRPGDERGELAVAVRFDAPARKEAPEAQALGRLLSLLREHGVPMAEACRELAAVTGVPKAVLYKQAHEANP